MCAKRLTPMAKCTFRITHGKRRNNQIYLNLFIEGQRFRYSTGEVIGVPIRLNDYKESEQMVAYRKLKTAFGKAIDKGWRPKKIVEYHNTPGAQGVIATMEARLQEKLNADYSLHYKRDLKYVVKWWVSYAKQNKLLNLELREMDKFIVKKFLDDSFNTAKTKKNIKVMMSALLRDAFEEQMLPSPFSRLKFGRTAEVMHKPFKDVKAVLDEIYLSDPRLHLCCMLAFGCLLRPHREVRCLKWEDFNEDLTRISLSGDMNKGKRNRVVPVPPYLKEYILRFKTASDPRMNIFTGTAFPYNPDFFKLLWRKYRAKSVLLQSHQTLYSFRHTGAIKVYEQTGSLQTLQQVMGHSNLQVTLTYLRGLEVQQLSVDDMPTL
jgi:integrase